MQSIKIKILIFRTEINNIYNIILVNKIGLTCIITLHKFATMETDKAKLLRQKNKLLTYKNILEIYNRNKTPDTPTTRILKNHIFPVYPITRATLYTILSTPVDKLLKQIQEIEMSVN